MSPKFYGQPTTCSGEPGHSHALPHDAPHVAQDVTMAAANRPVATTMTHDGRRVRWIGTVIFEETTGRLHVTPRLGATAVENAALLETATDPRSSFMPTVWPAHPCARGTRRIALCRYVDDGYEEEAAAEIVLDLHDETLAMAIGAWSEDLAGVAGGTA